MSETEEVSPNNYENVLPTPDAIKIYSEGKEYQQEDIGKAMELFNSVILSDNSDPLKLDVMQEHIDAIKKNDVCIELIYNSPTVINLKEKWKGVYKLLLPLNGDNEKILFKDKGKGYMSGTYFVIDNDGLQKLIPYFHVTPPKEVKANDKVIHNWDSIGDNSSSE